MMTSQNPENRKPEDDRERISKSQRKRDARDILALAREMVLMKPSALEKVLAATALDDDLVYAIGKARKIKSHGARKREIQFLAKLLRQVDTHDLRLAVEEPRAFARAEARRQQRLENWRDRLITGGDPVVQELCEHHPLADRQQLRLLIRKAGQEAGRNQPPAASRALFRLLAEYDRQQELPEIF